MTRQQTADIRTRLARETGTVIKDQALQDPLLP